MSAVVEYDPSDLGLPMLLIDKDGNRRLDEGWRGEMRRIFVDSERDLQITYLIDGISFAEDGSRTIRFLEEDREPNWREASAARRRRVDKMYADIRRQRESVVWRRIARRIAEMLQELADR